MRLVVVLASTRPRRVGPALADWITDVAKNSGAFETVELVDLAEVALPILDEPELPHAAAYVHEHTLRWSATVQAADAFLLVTPEYNLAPPPSLVNAIDYLHREWRWKAAGIVAYGGVAGGARSAQVVKQMLASMNCFTVHEAVVVPQVADQIDADNVFRATTRNEHAARSMIESLETLAGALRPVRVGDHD